MIVSSTKHPFGAIWFYPAEYEHVRVHTLGRTILDSIVGEKASIWLACLEAFTFWKRFCT